MLPFYYHAQLKLWPQPKPVQQDGYNLEAWWKHRWKRPSMEFCKLITASYCITLAGQNKSSIKRRALALFFYIFNRSCLCTIVFSSEHGWLFLGSDFGGQDLAKKELPWSADGAQYNCEEAEERHYIPIPKTRPASLGQMAIRELCHNLRAIPWSRHQHRVWCWSTLLYNLSAVPYNNCHSWTYLEQMCPPTLLRVAQDTQSAFII